MKKPTLLAQTYLMVTLLLFSCESIEEIEVGTSSSEIKQKLAPSADTSEALVCPIEIPCYQLTDNNVKPLSLKKDYSGIVVLKADYNRENLKFNKYKIEMTRLRHKEYEEPLELTDKELEQLLPILTKHVDYIKLKKNNREGCTEPSTFYLPVRIE